MTDSQFIQVWDQCRPRLAQYASRWTGMYNQADIEDILHTVFTYVWQKRDTFDHTRNPRAMVFHAAWGRLAHQHRDNKRRPMLSLDVPAHDDPSQTLGDTIPDPTAYGELETIAALDMGRALVAVLSRWGPAIHTAAIWVLVEGQTVADAHAHVKSQYGYRASARRLDFVLRQVRTFLRSKLAAYANM